MHLAHVKKIITLFMASVLAMLTLPAMAADAITTHEFMVDSAESGVRIFVRNKHRDDLTHFSANKIVLLVHGATYPSETVYDLNLPGGSWLEVLASQGYDAYLMDVRGYGRSTRPASMREPAENNPPFADTADARSDVSAVVDFILARRKVEKINLIGWSWGTSIMGGYTTTHNDKVNKLVLYAPVWNFNAAPPISGNGAYRSVAKDSARKRGLRGIPASRIEEISPTPWFEQWWESLLASDPDGAGQTPPVIRAPNGVIKDIGEFIKTGGPLYDAAEIRVPVLVLVGEWDQDTPPYMTDALFAKIVNAPTKEQVRIPEATHAIILEKQRVLLMQTVQDFLDR